MIQEKRALISEHKHGPGIGQISVNGGHGAGAQRHHPLAYRAARASHPVGAEIHILTVERHKLTDPHPGCIERLEHRAVTHCLRPMVSWHVALTWLLE